MNEDSKLVISALVDARLAVRALERDYFEAAAINLRAALDRLKEAGALKNDD